MLALHLKGATRLIGISQVLSFLRWEHSGDIFVMNFKTDNVQHSFRLHQADPAFETMIPAYILCEVAFFGHSLNFAPSCAQKAM